MRLLFFRLFAQIILSLLARSFAWLCVRFDSQAGGTSFTKVLRRMMCTRNGATEAELDCCDVGWCDWQKGMTCQNIHGCTNHIPRLYKWLARPLPSVTILRNPVTRFVSAWHYRCHHPNYDCFNVREEFKLIRVNRASKKTFDEYCAMAEYQNTIAKMLVKDKFPYGRFWPVHSFGGRAFIYSFAISHVLAFPIFLLFFFLLLLILL